MLKLHEVTVAFPPVAGRGLLRPVEGFSLDVSPGEIVGLCGPSGCGKTLLCSAVMGLLEPPGFVESGRILFDYGQGALDLAQMEEKQMRALRGWEIAMIFQDPVGALNPSRTVARQFESAIRAHKKAKRGACLALAEKMLAEMLFEDPARILRSYPFELSGGMCQRVAVAMAMVHAPRLLVADEPTTALDVKNQAQLLRLLARVREQTGAAVLLVSHDKRALAAVADRVVEMPPPF